MDKGCETPVESGRKDQYVTLAQMFAPVVCFHTQERFFPVDLPSTFAKSRLYRFRDRTHAKEYDPISDHPTLLDMAGGEPSYFTTVDRWREIPNVLKKPPFLMPVPWDPDLDSIYQKYAGGAIDAKLTTYVTACRPREVPNYQDLLARGTLRNGAVWAAILEGLLLNYYFFFPALKSPELRREGDWAGLSVLLHNDNPETAKPVLYCFHKKFRDPGTGLEAYGPGDEGFRTPKQVVLTGGATEAVWRRCRVYVSLGRHNCYSTVPLTQKAHFKSGIPWGANPQKVESGAYRPAPDKSITGDTDWSWTAGFLFPLLFLLACPHAGGKKSKYTGYQEGDDEFQSWSPAVANPVADDPTMSSTYPSPDWGYTQRHLQVKYVDTHDQELATFWNYPGYWGAAEQDDYTGMVTKGGDEAAEVTQETWGRFGGARRPNLSAWFLWNLYWDAEFGTDAGGVA